MNLPALLNTAALLGPDYQFVLPVAPTIERSWIDKLIQRLAARRRFQLVATRNAPAAIAHARAAVVASGTATVEAAMMGTPMVVVYRVSPLTWRLGRPLVHVKNFAMVNLIAGEQVVPELIQSDFTPAKVAARLGEILQDSPAREKMIRNLAQVRARLQSDHDSRSAADRAADAVLETLG